MTFLTEKGSVHFGKVITFRKAIKKVGKESKNGKNQA